MAHCLPSNILITQLHDFRLNHSTITNVLKLRNHFSSATDNGLSIDLNCIDITKAFDTVSQLNCCIN